MVGLLALVLMVPRYEHGVMSMKRMNDSAGRIRVWWILSAIAVMSYVFSDWGERNVLWRVALVVSSWFVGMHAMAGIGVRYLHILNGPGVEVWIPRAERRLRIAAFPCSGVVMLLIGNLWLCNGVLPTLIQEVRVERALCATRISGSPVRNGKVCFSKWTDHGYKMSAESWRLDVDRLPEGMDVGDAATLTLEVIEPDSALNWGQYFRVLSVR